MTQREADPDLGPGPAAPLSADATTSAVRDDRERLFDALTRTETRARFFERVAPDVDWTVQGTHPIAGRYRERHAFTTATFDRLARVMRDEIALRVDHLVVDGATAVVELSTLSTTLDGARYDNALCWVCRFDSAGPGATIVEVRAYLDSALVTWALLRNEPSGAAR